MKQLWQNYVVDGVNFVKVFVKYLRGWQDYSVVIVYEYTGPLDTLTSSGHVIARDPHHAVSLFLMQEMADPHGPEAGWKSFGASVEKMG
jgi:hypothetical protein